MKTKTLGWIVTLGLAGMGATASCSQPKPECQVALAGNYPYAAKYTLVSQPSAECQAYVKKGDMIGMEFYHPKSADGTTFDPSKTTVAVQADSLGQEAGSRDPDSNTSHKLYAMGAFSSTEPDANNFCTVPSFTAGAEQDFPATMAMGGGGAGGGTAAMPADTVKYDWSNMKVYVTASAQGTQFTADLTYTENNCSLQYKVVGMWPAVSCDNGMGQPDVTLCNPCANVDAGMTIGSGINPDFPYMCDPDLLLCVLADAKNTSQAATDIPQILSSPADCGSVM